MRSLTEVLLSMFACPNFDLTVQNVEQGLRRERESVGADWGRRGRVRLVLAACPLLRAWRPEASSRLAGGRRRLGQGNART